MRDRLELKKYIRNVDDFPTPGIKFRDITSLIETPEPFRKTCAELLTENFGFEKSDILISWIIDLPELGGSKLKKDQGYNIETLVAY